MMAMLVCLAALLSVVLVNGCNPNDMMIDCSDLYKAGQTVSGVYSIYPGGNVYCQMVSGGKGEDNGGWTVIQRRMDGSVNFYRSWTEYKRGFGNVQSEYWLGLENMYQLTRNRQYMLRVDLEDFAGRKGFALYSSFSVGAESEGYKLQVSGFKDGGAGDSLFIHNGQKFSTFDKDQDSTAGNCAKQHLGGFWYSTCHWANLNGLYIWGEDATHYATAASWYSWKNNHDIGMKYITMRIKPAS